MELTCVGSVPVARHKTCVRCERYLPVSLFNANPSNKDGLVSYCRPCLVEYGKSRRLSTGARCRSRLELPPDEVERRRVSRKAVLREIRRNDPAVVAAREARAERFACNLALRKKDKSAKRRAKKRGARTERVVRSEVFLATAGCCYLCGDVLPSKGWHLEHRVPLCRGGEHSMANCAASCSRCNEAKGSMTEAEFRATFAGLVVWAAALRARLALGVEA